MPAFVNRMYRDKIKGGTNAAKDYSLKQVTTEFGQRVQSSQYF